MAPQILVLDIERLIGKFEGQFWDPNAMKNRRIPPDWVTRPPRSICFAWKWEGDRKVYFTSEWDDGPEAMAQNAFDLYCNADIVVGHNIKPFDTPHLQALCEPFGLILPKVQHEDTLLIARREFNYEYNHLDQLCKRFGLPAKVDHYDPQVAEAAVLGSQPMQRKLKRYNMGDVRASEALGIKLRPYSGINFGAFGSEGGRFCPSCGGVNLQSRGTVPPTKAGYRYARFQCTDCGAWSQARKNDGSEMNEVKPA